MNSVYVLDQNFNMLGVIDEYVSIIWRPSYSDVGDFEIYLAATDKAIGLLREDNYVVRSDDVTVDTDGNTTYKKVMIIKNLQIVTDVENGDFVTVTGRELKYLLHQRIIWTQTNLSGNTEDALRRLVTENAISPTNSKRIIPKLVLGDKAQIKKILPDGYTRVEYIESAGAAYVNTGIVMSNTGYTMEVDFQFVDSSKTEQWICGWTWYEAGIYRDAFYKDRGFDYSQTTDKGARTIAIGSSNTSVTTTVPTILFGRCYESTINPCAAKVYSAKIWLDGVPVRNFIPCVNSTGIAGLYDAVNGMFYPSATSEAFTAGATIDGIADTIEKQITGDYLDQAIVDICTVYNYGWDIYIFNNQLVFSIYTGIDRTYNQSIYPYVVFSDNFENLYNTDYQLSTEEYANTTLIGGEGEGLDRIYTTIGDYYSGLERYETFTDVRDISQNKGSADEIPLATYYVLLQEKGHEKLSSLAYTEGFSGELLSDVAFKYGEDFYLGDLVTVINKYGISRDVRVLSAIESEDESGSKLVPQFNI